MNNIWITYQITVLWAISLVDLLQLLYTIPWSGAQVSGHSLHLPFFKYCTELTCHQLNIIDYWSLEYTNEKGFWSLNSDHEKSDSCSCANTRSSSLEAVVNYTFVFGSGGRIDKGHHVPHVPDMSQPLQVEHKSKRGIGMMSLWMAEERRSGYIPAFSPRCLGTAFVIMCSWWKLLDRVLGQFRLNPPLL